MILEQAKINKKLLLNILDRHKLRRRFKDFLNE